jgi:presenilin-like A22 family membrane protease
MHLIPVVASLLFGFLCGLTFKLTAQITIYPVTPFQEGIGSFGNAAYFVILVAIGATLIYILLRRRNLRIVTFITGFALITATFMLSMIYLSTLLSALNIPFADILSLASSIVITAVAIYAIFRMHGRIGSLAVLLLGGALGTFLGSTIETLSTILILAALAIYDAFAVYRGPVGKIAKGGLENLRGLSYSFGDIQMGLGDLTFYSMLSGHMLLYLGYAAFAASIIGILVGCALSFKMLEKKGMFPGLPFPIFFGLAAGFLTIFLP